MSMTFQPTTASAAVEGLPQVFDPATAAGVEAVVLFDLSGREPGQWTVVVRDATCRVTHGRTMEPTVTEYQVAGDLMFMMRFGKIFPVG